jgi:uroporphyrin-3 C-methyltransferase
VKKLVDKKSDSTGVSKKTATKKKASKKTAAKEVSKKVEPKPAVVTKGESSSSAIVSSKPSSSGSGAVAWIALLFSALALTAGGYSWYLNAVDSKLKLGQQDNKYELFGQRVDTFEKLQSDLGAQIAQLRSQTSQSDSDVVEKIRSVRVEMGSQASDVSQQLATAKQTLSDQSEAFRRDFDTLSDSILDLRSELGRGLDTWALEEVEQLISIANQRLSFAGEIGLAKKALELADARLRQLADPAFNPVRKQLSDDISALANVKSSDIVGVLTRLATLSSEVYTLPLLGDYDGAASKADQNNTENGEIQSNDDKESPAEGINKVLQPISNAVAKLLAALGDLIQVEKNGSSLKPVISDHTRQLIYERARLNLEAAQIAYVRKDYTLYGNRIDGVRQWIEQEYNQESNVTQTWLEKLNQIQSDSVVVELPSIDGSLQTMRMIMESRQ